MAKIMVPIAKGESSIEVETDAVPQDIFEYCFTLGLKQLLNRGMTKVTKALMPVDDERKAEAMAIAAKQLEAVLAGKVRMTGGVKAKAATGEVNTEAMRLARIIVKDEIKAAGGKISHYAASEITKAAKDLIAADDTIVAEAKKNIEARKEAKPKMKIDVTKIAVSAKKVADAEAKKAADKAKRDATKAAKEASGEKPVLSAKQAGKTAPRAVPTKGKVAPKAQPTA